MDITISLLLINVCRFCNIWRALSEIVRYYLFYPQLLSDVSGYFAHYSTFNVHRWNYRVGLKLLHLACEMQQLASHFDDTIATINMRSRSTFNE